MNRQPDWSLWRSFAAVIANGSLSAAARALKLSQPTLGRHIEALEASLGLPLGTVKALLHRARKRLIELTSEAA